jgi:hypothetical protein
MRVVTIGLGAITLALAVVLAAEGQWWIAMPDALFGSGVALMAIAGRRGDHAPPAAASEPAPAARNASSPPAAPAGRRQRRG